MGPMVRRALPRLLLLALVGGAFLPLGLARGQDGTNLPGNPPAQVDSEPSNPPAEEPREEQVETTENPATDQEPEGLQPTSDGGSPTTADIISVKVRTAECVEAPGSESRLGLMKNSAVHSHCP